MDPTKRANAKHELNLHRIIVIRCVSSDKRDDEILTYEDDDGVRRNWDEIAGHYTLDRDARCGGAGHHVPEMPAKTREVAVTMGSAVIETCQCGAACRSRSPELLSRSGGKPLVWQVGTSATLYGIR